MSAPSDDDVLRILLAEGAITQLLVHQARTIQQNRGGTLDTALLETGAVSLQQVSKALATAWKTNAPPASYVAEPQAEATSLLPESKAVEWGIAPLFLVDRELHAACLPPIDPMALADLAKTWGGQIVPYAAPEVRVQQAHVRAYGVPMDERLARLLVSDAEGTTSQVAHREVIGDEGWDDVTLEHADQIPKTGGLNVPSRISFPGREEKINSDSSIDPSS